MLDEKTVTPPRLEFGGTNPTTPYAAYAGVDTLHSLLRPRTDIAAERSFIVATQVMELLFGQLRFEWTQAQHALRTDDLPGAMAALRRGLGVQDVLTGSWDILGTLTPMEFSSFRAALGEASGFQSYMYLHLEFLLGNKSPGLVKLYAAVPDVLKELTETLNSPSLYDDVLAVLRRRGVLAAEAGDPAEAAASAAYVARTEVEQAWLAVYEDEDERYQDVKQLAELMLDVAERVSRWRQRHLAAVKRSMGTKPGTGGSSGLHWLRKAAEQDVFPELWTVRNEL